jgi:hypothetical protein
MLFYKLVLAFATIETGQRQKKASYDIFKIKFSPDS